MSSPVGPHFYNDKPLLLSQEGFDCTCCGFACEVAETSIRAIVRYEEYDGLNCTGSVVRSVDVEGCIAARHEAGFPFCYNLPNGCYGDSTDPTHSVKETLLSVTSYDPCTDNDGCVSNDYGLGVGDTFDNECYGSSSQTVWTVVSVHSTLLRCEAVCPPEESI